MGHGCIPAIRLIVAQRLIHHGDGIFSRLRLGYGQGQTGQNLVPTRGEEQPIVSYDPGMLVLLVAGDRV